MKKLIALLPLLGLAACSSPHPTQYQYRQYQCGEEMLAVTYDAQADMVQFPHAGVYYKLDRVETKTGGKYSDGVTTFWDQSELNANKKNEEKDTTRAVLIHNGVQVLTCTRK
ncbi:MAG: MliC family protein [Aeromonas sp.]